MTTTPYAKTTMKIDGAPVVSGAQLVAGGNVIQLLGESTVNWNNQLWQIYEYPPGYALPAGWTNNNGIYECTLVVPPTFTIDATSSRWGKYLTRLIVNNGILAGVYAGPGTAQPLVDLSGVIQTKSPKLGLTDIAFQETNQFDPVRQWVGELKTTLRSLDSNSSSNVTQTPLGSAPLVVVKDVTAGSVNHRTIKITGKKSGEQDPAGATGEIHLRPVPPGHFNPCDYGATFDGVTDDRAAIQSMLDAMPSTGGRVQWPDGTPYISGSLRISKPIHLVGIGGTGALHCGVDVAPGAPAMIFDCAAVSLDGNDASGHYVHALSLHSKIMIHSSANGSANGYGLRQYNPGGVVRRGDVYTAGGTASPTVAFRADTSSTVSGAFAASEPAWNTTIGGTTVSNGITFTCEAIPSVRANSTAYAVGQRVFANIDNRFYYQCTVAGTSAASPPATFAGGDAVGGVIIGSSVTDGGVTWVVKLHCGIYIRAGLGTIGTITADGFTGYALHFQGGVNQDVAGTTNADNFGADKITVNYCGGGVYVGGDDTNGYEINRLWTENVGTLLPTPNVASTAGYTNLGGHTLHCHSQASGTVSNLYAQLSTGRAILKTGLGIMRAVSCYGELGAGGNAKCVGGSMLIEGGNITDDAAAALVIQSTSCKNIKQTTGTSPVVTAGLTTGTTGAYSLAAPVGGDPNYYAIQYALNGTPGWWAQQHGQQATVNAYQLSTAAAGSGVDPGPGWMSFPNGVLRGAPATVAHIFTGPSATLIANILRGGLRRSGDVFTDGTSETRITKDGYRGPSWRALTASFAAYSAWGIQASVVEPTVNGSDPAGGRQVWICTTQGTTGATEPAWPAAPVAGTTTIADGTVVWTYLGATPYWIRDYATTIATTDATATYFTLASLQVGDVVECDALVTVKKADGTVRQVFKLSGQYYGAAGPVATLDGGTPTASGTGTGTAVVTIETDGAGVVRIKIVGIAATNLDTTISASVT